MKKVIVIASYQYLPYFSGGQKSIAQFLDYLGGACNLTVVGVKDNDVSLMKTYRYLPWLKEKSIARYSDLSLISKLTDLLKKEKFELIIWEHPYYTWLAGIIKRRTGITTVLHIHNIEYRRFQTTGKWWWWLLRSYEKRFFHIADKILFVSPDDQRFAIDNWNIEEHKCIEVAFGVEIREYPSNKLQCRQMVKDAHNIGNEEKILLFNGLLDYKPNLDALITILKQINPILSEKSDFRYKILICGKRLPAGLNDLEDYTSRNVVYAGFVADIEMYFKAANLFLNPVQSGGGIKTKMVESIAFGTTVIATETGAMGIHTEVCGGKLITVHDNDWPGFANAILKHSDETESTPSAFYNYYYWGNVVKRLLDKI